ncbi:hypothetical protein QA584_21215 [Anaerocolumna sp. AGMB13025]|uniref:hypothetical protein n=1 Tax=Anaerocolumna sp. AGMB13025 TaxID=3039116 RepID=UPI00241D8B32|nr:hypothetical protein [Anaerocolumna sp. AGMB13025]WFR56113.1 hypothetical protein QA584_21215 [Anaerocolumna sp. AGMB13025]
MNTGIDVVAAFNPMGDIKPVYARLECENHLLQTYKLEVNSTKQEKYSGLTAFLFVCSIERNCKAEQIRLRYYCDSHKWVLVS